MRALLTPFYTLHDYISMEGHLGHGTRQDTFFFHKILNPPSLSHGAPASLPYKIQHVLHAVLVIL